MTQRELFPDAVDVEADALDALEELDVARGLERVRRARRIDPDLPNLDALEAALAWLDHALDGARDAAFAARAFLARPRADLPPGAASLADRALARRGLALARDAFVDDEARVPRGALLLVLDRRAAAWRELSALAASHADRGDVQGYAADAAWLAGGPERANELLVRALVADPARVDLARTRRPALAALARELGCEGGQGEGALFRARLFPEAWLRAELHVPPGNAWLDGLLSRLAVQAPPSAREPATRLRRFALLLYADRSRPTGEVDLATREELAALDPELFGRVMERLRGAEGA